MSGARVVRCAFTVGYDASLSYSPERVTDIADFTRDLVHQLVSSGTFLNHGEGRGRSCTCPRCSRSHRYSDTRHNLGNEPRSAPPHKFWDIS